MSFRARLTILSAVAVAIAVALACGLAYIVVRSNLRGQVDESLTRRADVMALLPPIRSGGIERVAPTDVPPPQFGDIAGSLQLVTSSGTLEVLNTEDPALPVTERTLAVARGESGSFFFDATVDGTHVRIYTAPAGEGLAVQVARSLAEVDSTLRRLGLILLFVGIGGIVLATALGAAIARTAMAPIRRLSEATAHVTSTHDLSRRIEVTGNDELSRLGEDFNEMMGELEESQRAQRQLAADASHELRTPLTSLRTNIEVLVRGRLPPDQRAALLDDVVIQLEELTVLMGDLVDLARNGTLVEEAEDVRLDVLVAEAIDRARRHAPSATFDADLEPTIVRGVPARIDRAVANLLDNAVKWSPPDAPIVVTVGDGRVVVRDHGPGIDEADLPFVFDRFYRAAAARRLPGSGLGLAIVRQTAESHGGSVQAANAAGGGAELSLSLAESRS